MCDALRTFLIADTRDQGRRPGPRHFIGDLAHAAVGEECDGDEGLCVIDAHPRRIRADYQSDGLEATNIDDSQIALGLQGGPGLAVEDLNRMEYFRDFNADLGGYVKKDVLWWYQAFRYTRTSQRYPNLIDNMYVAQRKRA